YAAHVRLIGEKLGLTLRNWIIWHYTFGQQTKAKFARAHTHIFYFVKNKDSFTFNDTAVRVLSDRQKIYKDKRANPAGKLPDDVWNEFPRICGTFEERQGWHPCQMPESILARIIRASSNPGDLVLDPFSGSGTTPVTAAKLERRYSGIDISEEYVKETRKRLQLVQNNPIEGENSNKWAEHAINELKWLYHENKISTEQLTDEPYLLGLFTEKFNIRMKESFHSYTAEEIRKKLRSLRKSGKLGPLQNRVKSKN
ncbi:MAG: site-specific DNA-methyltransferase, partial [Anaerohalosphaera sp.]|nr:site-specific DNA-methyltransferase [Anaerohalosphaera sp.]